VEIRSKDASISPTTPHMRCAWPRFAIMFRPSNRYVVFQALPHSLGLGPEVWRVLAKGHEIRNRGEYEGDLNIDERILADLITACSQVAAKVNALKPLR